jgi:hypothetical protein
MPYHYGMDSQHRDRLSRLHRITPRILAAAIPGTSARWWERRMRRLTELRDADDQPVVVRVDRRYLGDLDALAELILHGALDSEAA